MPPSLKIPASVQDWFFVAIERGHDQTIRLVLELEGRVDVPRLRHALRHILEAEPVLQCRFLPGLFRAWWVARDDVARLEVDPALELCTLVATAEPSRDVHAFMGTRIDPRRDPLLQIPCVSR